MKCREAVEYKRSTTRHDGSYRMDRIIITLPEHTPILLLSYQHEQVSVSIHLPPHTLVKMPAYRVYKVQFPLTMKDPDITDPAPRYHNIIWVETVPGKNGIKHHVTGDLVKGMYYEGVAYHHPSNSKTKPAAFDCLGYTDKSPAEWDAFIKKNVPAPPPQKAFNTKTMKTEPFKLANPLTFYAPGEPRKPLRKCTEWTNQDAIPKLKAAGYIKAGSPPASRPATPTTRPGSAGSGSSTGKKATR